MDVIGFKFVGAMGAGGAAQPHTWASSEEATFSSGLYATYCSGQTKLVAVFEPGIGQADRVLALASLIEAKGKAVVVVRADLERGDFVESLCFNAENFRLVLAG